MVKTDCLCSVIKNRKLWSVKSHTDTSECSWILLSNADPCHLYQSMSSTHVNDHYQSTQDMLIQRDGFIMMAEICPLVLGKALSLKTEKIYNNQKGV